MLGRSMWRAATALVLLVAGCGTERDAPNGEAGVPEPFRGTVGITLTRDGLKRKVHVRVSDPDTVREFLAAIRLVPKEPCKCEHMEEAIFETESSSIRVSLCDHCFDFQGKHYRMPGELYQLFQREIDKAGEEPRRAPK